MKETRRAGRGIKIDKEGWGFIEVGKITLGSGEEATSRMEFIHPDDDNAEDKILKPARND